MSKATLLFVGAGRHQADAIRQARAAGYRVVACDGNAQAEGLHHADQAYVIDITNPDLCLKVAAEQAVDGILAICTEVGVRGAAYAAEQLRLPGPTMAAATIATDKLLMRRTFVREGIASTSFEACADLAEAHEVYHRLGPRVVVKPRNGSGSRGVSYVEREHDLAPAFKAARDISGTGPALIETYMPGVEVAAEAFMVDGDFHLLCISDKVRTKPPYLLDLRIDYPSPRPGRELRAIARIAARAARALGVRRAPLHVEIMMTESGPRIVEIAVRGAGFHVFTKIVPWVTGVDTIQAQIELALGRTPHLAVRRRRAAILDFPVVAPGKLVAADGAAALAADRNVLFYELFRKVGDTVGALRSGADRVAALCVCGETLMQAQAALSDAYRSLKLVSLEEVES
jgi:biotin carboxylase